MKLSQSELNIAITAINQYIDEIEQLLPFEEKESVKQAYKKVINDLRKQAGKNPIERFKYS